LFVIVFLKESSVVPKVPNPFSAVSRSAGMPRRQTVPPNWLKSKALVTAL